jgi:hypothetical protein
MENREAIEWLKGCVVAYEVDNKGKPNGNVTCDLIQEVIDMAISALEKQEQDRWIPVTERMPKKGEYGKVLVTFIPSAGTLWKKVMIAHYSDLMGIAKPCFWIGVVGKNSFENITSSVTAWRPLPEAFEVEDEA